jgi:ribosomal protein L7/L12
MASMAEVTLRVESVGPRKILVIKVVREALRCGLKEAKDRVDSAPFEVSMGDDQDAAEALAVKLREVGADARVTSRRTAASGLRGAVVLEQIGPRKINVIKVVREHLGLGLADTKRLVESAPVVLKESCDPDEARRFARELRDAGARVSLGAEPEEAPAGGPKPLGY